MSGASHHAFEQAIINASGKVAGAGGLTAVGSGVAGKYTQAVAQNPDVAQVAVQWADVGVMAGIGLGIAGYITQLIFQWRRDRRESKVFLKKMSEQK